MTIPKETSYMDSKLQSKILSLWGTSVYRNMQGDKTKDYQYLLKEKFRLQDINPQR
jgi:hypothetical protein